MENKTTEWMSGPAPTVCRCCLAEGCYKDISTEYFWMGKREVYAEMLSETFDLSIAYAQTGGPNSHSRLICEPCISRLRDASEFKKQVQECEKTFINHLDPCSTTVTVEIEPSDQVKLETVKEEQKHSDSEDFDDRLGFEDDDDDLDDQPLTKLASKPLKKEKADLLDLLDNSQAPVKRKSTLKAKAPPAKKAKLKIKEKAKPSPSKAPTKTPKKKKGSKHEEIQRENDVECDAVSDTNVGSQRNIDNERRSSFRNNLHIIMESCTACPFKYRSGTYLCFFCKSDFFEPEKLREHTLRHHSSVQLCKPRKYEPIKMDFSDATCKLCGAEIIDYNFLKLHLKVEHGKHIDCSHGDCVLPYKLSKGEHCCLVCGERYEVFLSLHKHMNEHYEHYICETCGKKFATAQRMHSHAQTHVRGSFPCKRCDETFPSLATVYSHVAKIHRSNKRYKCPICSEKFVSYKHRLTHLTIVHGEKTAEFCCPFCPKVFDLCSRRTAHIRFQHLQERNHVCEVCGMKFFTKYELHEHSIKHGGERIYQCDICKKSYARMKTLREHMRIHNNDRRFVCSVCAQSFVQKCSLKQHVRVHHPVQLKIDLF